MRLGQLARKLDVKINQIIDFLEEEHQIKIENDLNTKLDEDTLTLVNLKFKATKTDTIVSNTTEEISEETTIINESVENEMPLINETPTTNAGKIKDISAVENEEDKLIVLDEDGEPIELNVVDGVIKAPKKEIPGFKVVGKIELKQPKKSIQFVKTEDGKIDEITEEISEKRKALAKLKREKYLKRKQNKKKQQQRKSKRGKKTILSELELKEQQAELLVKKRLEQAKISKEKKKKHYEQIAKSKLTRKQKKKKEKKLDNTVIKSVKQFEKEPTTLLGKIWKWFNT